jgi:adenosylmethionine-8-amino-7-oxononanoate aminotransferase
MSVPRVLHPFAAPSGLPYPDAVALSPPLITSDAEIDELVDAMGEALGEVAAAV